MIAKNGLDEKRVLGPLKKGRISPPRGDPAPLNTGLEVNLLFAHPPNKTNTPRMFEIN
jgi:hypothetical protein